MTWVFGGKWWYCKSRECMAEACFCVCTRVAFLPFYTPLVTYACAWTARVSVFFDSFNRGRLCHTCKLSVAVQEVAPSIYGRACSPDQKTKLDFRPNTADIGRFGRAFRLEWDLGKLVDVCVHFRDEHRTGGRMRQCDTLWAFMSSQVLYYELWMRS